MKPGLETLGNRGLDRGQEYRAEGWNRDPISRDTGVETGVRDIEEPGIGPESGVPGRGLEQRSHQPGHRG